jgi:nucleotide-binding universal stress UspA family protein
MEQRSLRCFFFYRQEYGMFKHILLPTDGSKLSHKAVKQAISLASQLGARITAMNVMTQNHIPLMDDGFLVPEIPVMQQRLEKAQADIAKKILDAVRKSAAGAGVESGAVAVTSDLPYEAIIKQAEKSRCDLIVMASHGRRGLQGVLLGSETVKVLTHSTIPVLVIR